MKLLIDTNIFLEIILEQEEVEQARNLLSKIEEYDFYISDYSLHSIGLLLFRRQQHDVFRQFLADMIFNAGVRIIEVPAKDMELVINTALKSNLNFDDAYQCVAAAQYGLTIVSLDSDFDRTERGRKTPAQLTQ